MKCNPECKTCGLLKSTVDDLAPFGPKCLVRDGKHDFGVETERKIYLISDTHFNHEKLEQWGGRSGNWQEELLDGLWGLKEEDLLIHLGDICIGADDEIHNKLKLRCKKILVRGNHDKKSHNWYLDHGWDFVCDGLELIFHGHYLHLTHRPARPQGNTTWNIHGHTHGNMHRSEEYLDFYSPEYHIDISPEIVGFKPVLLKTLLDKQKRNG